MLGWARDDFQEIRSNPGKLKTLFQHSNPLQLLRGVKYSLEHTSNPTGIILGKSSNIEAKNSNIVSEGRIILGCDERRHLRDTRTFLCLNNGELKNVSGGNLHLASGTRIMVNGGSLEIGDVTTLYGCQIYCREKITIGDGCGIGANVEIRDGHSHTVYHDGEKKPNTEPIIIEDDVAIPSNAIIKKGVTIHEGAIVASGSVVAQDVPPNTLVAGVPAEVKMEGVSWEM